MDHAVISHLATTASPPTTTSVISPPTLFVVMTSDLTDEVVLLLTRYGRRSLHRCCRIGLWNVVYGMVFRFLQIMRSEIVNTYVSKAIPVQAVEACRAVRCRGSHIL
jgi:hypothetical protein